MNRPTLVNSGLGPIVIVGIRGIMGRWFSQMFEVTGLEVLGIESDTSDEEALGVISKGATILFSVPISKTREVIARWLPHVSADSLVVDLTSIKSVSVPTMKEHRGEIVSIHPMCGPADTGLQNQIVTWNSLRDGPRQKLLYSWLVASGAKITEMDFEKHDLLMAFVQGLNHFQSIVLARTFSELGVDIDDTLSVASPIYLLRMQLMGRILAQNPELYAEIEIYNPFMSQALKALSDQSAHFEALILKGDIAGCSAFFKEAATALKNFPEKAKRDSDRLLAMVQNNQDRQNDIIV